MGLNQSPPRFYAKRLFAEGEAPSAGGDDESFILSDEVIEELFKILLNSRRGKGKK